jgi:CheY-like chemotaxis protein
VELQWRLEQNPWYAFADQSQLELALMNLIINARDAMPDGGTIRIDVEHRGATVDDPLNLPAGDYVVFAVEDTGSGIPPELLEKVMEPFFTTKEVGKGTGLGLSMIYGFAQQSNGAFRLQSDVSKGTRAELWLPRADAPPLKQEQGSSEVKVVNGEGLTVLLVDDHHEVRVTTAGMFHDLGHKVVEASSGAEALQLLGEHRIDLLVSDYAMPQLSGTELVRDARSHNPRLTTLIITGYADQREISDLPTDVIVLPKPFDLSTLAAAIAQATGPRVDGTS